MIKENLAGSFEEDSWSMLSGELCGKDNGLTHVFSVNL